MGLWVVDALGAHPSTKRHPKLSEALAENKLDGALMSFQLAQSLDVIESQKSHTLRAENKYFGTSLFLFLMNRALRRFAGRPASRDRSNSGVGLAKRIGRIWRDAGQNALAAARTRQHHYRTERRRPARLVEIAFSKILARWSDTVPKRGIDGPQMIEKARQAIRQYQVSKVACGRHTYGLRQSV